MANSDIAMQEKKSEAENQNYGGSMEIKKHERGKAQHSKNWINYTQTYSIWCQHLEMD